MSEPRSLCEVVAEGDHLESLIALRDRLAAELDASSKQSAAARDVAAISKQLMDVLERITLLKPPEKSKVDDLAKRRAKRQYDAWGPGAENSLQSSGSD